MLTQIHCDKFAKESQTINFFAGLNTVLGNADGSNALGKSTFLWIVDFVFGGEGYCMPDSDIKSEVKDHTIEYAFRFDGTDYFFHRSTSTPKSVSQCDKAGHLIKTLTLEQYRKFLGEHYSPRVPIDEICGHYFRIYGKENTFEKYPYLTKPKEMDEKAVDFLLKAFGKGSVLSELKKLEDELGVKETQWIKASQKPKSFEKIGENEGEIASLRERMNALLNGQSNVGIEYLGLGTDSFEKIQKMKKELRALSKRRSQLLSKLEAVQSGNKKFIETSLADDFEELSVFFPNANIKELLDIENFHRQLHEILQSEIAEEIDRLNPLISSCDKEIKRLTEKLEDSGIATDLTQRILSQCVSISKRIDKLEEENRDLVREKELQEQRILAERKLESLINDRISATDDMVHTVNAKIAELNAVVTDGKETPPVLAIERDKTITFATRGNTSEGTAFKSMILFDLAILSLTNIPALIHDGNILHSISQDHFEKIVDLYKNAGKQIFIAVSKENSDLLKDTVVLELSEGHELFGYSWSKNRS